MKLKPFQLERYFAQYEFTAKYLLSSSDCDGLSLAEVLALATPEERAVWQNQKLGYTESLGWPALREEISTLYSGVNPEEVVVMSPGEVNFIYMNTLLEKTDHVICMAPAYQSLYEVVNGIGCEVSFWNPVENELNRWHYDTDQLERLVQKTTKLLIINFPHNPTGFVPHQQDYDAIISFARKHALHIFSDEMYRLLTRKKEDTLNPVCEVYERGVSLWGMAKTFALAGLRLGWVVCKDKKLRNEIAGYKDYLTICSSTPSEILSWIALRHCDVIVSANNKMIAENVMLFASFCEKHSSFFSFHPPKAGSTAFVKLLSGTPALQFSEKLVSETGIMALPSEMFDFGNQHLRIGFGRASMNETLSVLDHYLTAQK